MCGLRHRFFAITHKAKQLASNNEAFAKVAPLIEAKDAATLAIYRRRYAEGIPARAIGDEQKEAAALYQVLAKLGGEQLLARLASRPMTMIFATHDIMSE